MSEEQLELKAVKAPVEDVAEVDLLIQALAGRGWMNAKQLSRELGLSDRAIRAAAHASDGQVISGQKGYKLTREATIEEVQHAAGWLRHQAKEMSQRAIEIDIVYHRKAKPNES